MGRLCHLRQTLPSNLETIKDLTGFDFVLVNYNSQDGMDEWVKTNCQPVIQLGILNYYRTIEPKFYHSSHAKNVAHRLGSGDILINLDADNFLSTEYCDALKQHQEQDLILRGGPRSQGLVSLPKTLFYELGGYDETLVSWGNDDTDLVRRAQAFKNIALIYLSKKNQTSAIKHSNTERMTNFQDKDLGKCCDENGRKTDENIKNKIFTANQGNIWGQATLNKNFSHIIKIP